MITSLSWSQYGSYMALFFGVYYLILGLVGYRREAVQWWRRWRHPVSPSPDRAPHLVTGAPAAEVLPSEEARFNSLIDEAQAFFESAKSQKWEKEALLPLLQHLIAKYAVSTSSTYAPSFKKFLQVQCAHFCSLDLSEEDWCRVWMG